MSSNAGAEGVGAPHAFKIVVAGPVGAGKTTFINTISEIQTVSTEAAISDGSGRGSKTTTTVGIDFGRLTLTGGLELYLFGTPGQERFDFMWDIVSEGMLGLIVLVDCSEPSSHSAALKILNHFRATTEVPVIIAANKVGDFEAERDGIAKALGLNDEDFLVPTNALDAAAVKQTLIEVLELVVANTVDPAVQASA